MALQAHALPPGASHWDRLPPELHHMIAKLATPELTRFLSRRLVAAETRCMSQAARERLWTEVFECDWQGDLAVLPPISNNSRCLHSIATESMVRRLRSLGLDAKPQVMSWLALRNGWKHLIDLSKPENLAETAARQGSVNVLRELCDVRRLVQLGTKHAEDAASEGHAGVVKWLRGRMHGVEWPPSIMDAAARSGNLGLVVWLSEVGHCTCSGDTMVNAASGGHLRIVKWLADNAQIQCPADAFSAAATNGHVDVLDLLRVRFPDRFAEMHKRSRIRSHHLAVLRWISVHVSASLRLPPLEYLIPGTNIDDFEWLMTEINGSRSTSDLLAMAIRANHAELAKWLVVSKHAEIQLFMLRSSLAQRNLDALEWVISHDSRWAAAMAGQFVLSGEHALVEWLHVRHRGSVTQSALELAIRPRGHLTMRFLLDRINSAEWDLERAKQVAMRRGTLDIAHMLYARVRSGQ
ncbi:hypothetical protein HK105_205461 [Polyrhizophydium stewartii]|uniref:Ankyrin repeat domain containing protein n=1 Tax=Polyrhizophydium stewartii TaxID=2732419 RepID=A0ABR4N5Y6_9FUNG